MLWNTSDCLSQGEPASVIFESMACMPNQEQFQATSPGHSTFPIETFFDELIMHGNFSANPLN
jgi:hypothetical protein